MTAFEPAPGDDEGTITIPYSVEGEPKAKPFPESGSIRYSRFYDIARDKLPRPTPDTDMVAARFRIWAGEKNISLSAKTIDKTFGDFCSKWRQAGQA